MNMGGTIEIEGLRRVISPLVDHSALCLARLAQQRKSSDLSDVTLRVREDVYPAHKFILASVSDVFKVMLTGEMWKKEDSIGSITLDESPECCNVFDDFLQYIYTGQVTLNGESVGGLLMLADKYNIAGLLDSCCAYMMNNLDKAEDDLMVVTWHGIAQLCNKPSLERSCFAYIKLNLDHVMTCKDEWNNMPYKTLLSILDSSDIIVENEEVLLGHVLEWYEFDAKARIKQLLDLLARIRFPFILPERLKKLEKSKEYNNHKELLAPYINMAYRHYALSIREDDDHECNGGFNTNFEYRNYTDEQYGIKVEFSFDTFESLKVNQMEEVIFKEPLPFPSPTPTEDTDVHVRLYPKGIEGGNISIKQMVLEMSMDEDVEFDISLAFYVYDPDPDGGSYLARQTTGKLFPRHSLLIDRYALDVIKKENSPYLTNDGLLDCIAFVRPSRTCRNCS